MNHATREAQHVAAVPLSAAEVTDAHRCGPPAVANAPPVAAVASSCRDRYKTGDSFADRSWDYRVANPQAAPAQANAGRSDRRSADVPLRAQQVAKDSIPNC